MSFLPRHLLRSPSRLPLPRVSPAGAATLAGALVCALAPVPGFLALAAGIAIALGFGAPAWGPAAGNRLLKASVVALGAGMNLAVVLRAGVEGLGATALTLTTALVVGGWLGRRLGVGRDVALLVTVGTAICGGSAIAATAPVLRARPADVGLALGVVFLLNGIALVLFPVVGAWAGLDAHAFGQWCALAIHDTSSVVGAAATRGPEALELATVTKLARALWIVPVTFVVAWVARPARGEGKRVRPQLPLFILAFVAAAGVVTLFPALQPAGRELAGLAKRGMTVALFAIGLGFTRESVRALGVRPLALGIGLWVLLGAGSLAVLAAA